FEPEFEPFAFGDRELLKEREVKVLEAIGSQSVPSQGSKRTCGRYRKDGWVEPLGGRSVGRVWIAAGIVKSFVIAETQGATRCISCYVCNIAGRADKKRYSGTKR